MPRTRRSEKGKRKTLEASDIKSFDTCIDIDLPRDLCCDKCQVTIDQINNLTKKPSVKKKRFRDYAEDSVNRCKQPWASRNGNDKKTIGTIRNFQRARNYLKIDTTVWIDGIENKSVLVDHYCYSQETKKIRTTK